MSRVFLTGEMRKEQVFSRILDKHVELSCLGNRAQYEYKAASMEKMGVMVTGSSDSPVTGRPDPLIGIAMAAFRFRKEERMTVESMRKAFSENGAYQLFREREIGCLAQGFSADIIGLSGQITERGMEDGSEKVKLKFVMADGNVLFSV